MFWNNGTHPLFFILSMAAFVLQEQSIIVATLITELKIFAI